MPKPRVPKPQRGDRYVAANIKYMKEFPTNDQKMALLPIIQTSSKYLTHIETKFFLENLVSSLNPSGFKIQFTRLTTGQLDTSYQGNLMNHGSDNVNYRRPPYVLRK